MWPLIQIAAYIWTTLLSDHIVAIYPPLEACFWTCPLQWRWRCWWWQILQWHRNSISYSYRWRPNHQNSSRIIIRRRRADIARRWEHPWDLASTSLLPLTVRLLSWKKKAMDSPVSGRGGLLGWLIYYSFNLFESKIGNVKIFFPFCLLKQAPSLY